MIYPKKNILKLAICLGLVCVLSACVMSKNKQSPFSVSKEQTYTQIIESQELKKSFVSVQEIRRLEAKYSDLPIPLNAVPIPAHCVYNPADNEQIKLAYHCSDTIDSIGLFFDQMMEGWQEIGRFAGDELLIIYQRPDRWCSILIKPNNLKNIPNLIVYMAQSKQVFTS